jgi:hypothetical protein
MEGLSLMYKYNCSVCNKEVVVGDVCYQIPVDSRTVGFTHIHKECMIKLKPAQVVKVTGQRYNF